MTEQIKQELFLTGSFWAPDTPDGHNVSFADLRNLKLTDQVCVDAIRTRSIAQVTDYAPEVFSAHGRAPQFDGVVGQAYEMMRKAERCFVPDHVPPHGVDLNMPAEFADIETVCRQMQADMPAFGDGNWKGCHSVGQYHSASVDINRAGIGSHLKPVFDQALRNVQLAYAQIGLLFHFIESDRNVLTGEEWGRRINIQFSFVPRSGGWIGLAIVGQNQVCTSNIWCRYLASYRPSNVVSEWTTLIKHELGHNCGMGHFPGNRNVMNPSIIRGLPTEWSAQDSSTAWLKRRFGGEPVDSDAPPPEDDSRLAKVERELAGVQSRLDNAAVQDAIQEAAIQWLISKHD